MVAVQRKMASSEDLSSTDYVDAMDYVANPRRSPVRLVHRGPPEDADSHELHDSLTKEEQCDCNDFHEGKMVVCACTQRIMEEEEAEKQQAQMYG